MRCFSVNPFFERRIVRAPANRLLKTRRLFLVFFFIFPLLCWVQSTSPGQTENPVSPGGVTKKSLCRISLPPITGMQRVEWFFLMLFAVCSAQESGPIIELYQLSGTCQRLDTSNEHVPDPASFSCFIKISQLWNGLSFPKMLGLISRH